MPSVQLLNSRPYPTFPSPRSSFAKNTLAAQFVVMKRATRTRRSSRRRALGPVRGTSRQSRHDRLAARERGRTRSAEHRTTVAATPTHEKVAALTIIATLRPPAAASIPPISGRPRSRRSEPSPPFRSPERAEPPGDARDERELGRLRDGEADAEERSADQGSSLFRGEGQHDGHGRLRERYEEAARGAGRSDPRGAPPGRRERPKAPRTRCTAGRS